MALLEEPIKEILKLKNYINGEWVESEPDQVLDIINPATQKTIAKVPMPTRDEVNTAIEAAREAFPDWRRTTPLARVRCLFRLKELLALKWRDLDLDLACIYVAHSLHRLDDGNIIIKEPKTSSSRRPVDLPPSLVLLLRQHRIDQEVQQIMFGQNLDENSFVFSRADSSPLNPSTVTHAFSKMAARAGLPHLRLHDLRHIHATMLLKAGVHPRVVQERLGHSNIASTLDNLFSHSAWLTKGSGRMA